MSAITATLMAPVGERNLQAGVVGGKGDVRAALEGDTQLELDLSRADVRERGRVAERHLHSVSVPDGGHGDRRGERWTLIDDDLAFRS
jgi:hypothetical protein